MSKKLKPIVLTLLLAVITALPGICAGVYQAPGGSAPIGAVTQSGSWSVTSTPTGLAAAQMTSVTQAVPASDTTVTLTAASQNVVIINQSTSATLYVNFNGTATTSNGGIAPGAALKYSGVAVSSVHVLGSAAAGNFVVFAN